MLRRLYPQSRAAGSYQLAIGGPAPMALDAVLISAWSIFNAAM
jgi:hypothetical protein